MNALKWPGLGRPEPFFFLDSRSDRWWYDDDNSDHNDDENSDNDHHDNIEMMTIK
jgi:hypothetical protein